MNAKRLENNIISSKLSEYSRIAKLQIPSAGWIAAIRSALNMTLSQLGTRMGITRQAVSKMEKREAMGNITLNNLRAVAESLDMHLVYAIVPKEGTLEEYVEKRALQLAREIVMGSNQQMRLEDQAVADPEVEETLRQLAAEYTRTIDRQLWD